MLKRSTIILVAVSLLHTTTALTKAIYAADSDITNGTSASEISET
jgi:hypothetical protein